jgi:Ca2+-binding RTX toxin-like protein
MPTANGLPPMKRALGLLFWALLVTAAGATPAVASSVRIDYNVLSYTAGAGEANVLSAQFSPKTGTIVIGDRGAVISAGAGCVAALHYAVCTPDPQWGAPRANILVGDRNDSVKVTRLQASVLGGAGNDTLTTDFEWDNLRGEEGNDTLYALGGDDLLVGGPGHDRLYGGADEDDLNGEAGDDLLDGGPGGDWMFGGPGADTFRGGSNGPAGSFRVDLAVYNDGTTAPVSITLNGLADDGHAGEGDNVGADVEQLWGSAGNDTISVADAAPQPSDATPFDHWLIGEGGDDLLIGGSGRDDLQGDNGNDTLRGNAGDDWLLGGFGNDTLLARDGQSDERITCDAGVDSAQIDPALDKLVLDCETLLP